MNALERLKSIVDELSGSLEYLAYLEAAVDAAGFVVKHDGGSLGDSNFRLEPKLATDPCRCIECGGDQPEHSPECAYMAEIVGGVAQVDGVHLAVIGRRHFGNPIPQEWYAAARELLAAAPGIDVDALAQEIRRVDGTHSLGAGALAEALVEWLSRHVIDASPKGGSDATLAYWRVTFRMYRDDPELCVLFVGGQEKPTLDSIGVTPRPIELVNVEPRFVEQNRLAEPSIEATPSIAVDPSTEVTPLTDAARSPVTDAMVELACNAFTAAGRRERALPSLSPRWMRAALEAAMQATSAEVGS